nr:BMC domain-containing protein [Sodalis sp. dw_96]
MEVTGLSLAITVADVMAKTASVSLLGVERTIGSGWMLVKIHGDVASVRTALSAGEEMARRCSGFIACTAIARPAKGTSEIVSAALRQGEGVMADNVGAEITPAGTTTLGETREIVAVKTAETDDNEAPAEAADILENPEAVANGTGETDDSATWTPDGTAVTGENINAVAAATPASAGSDASVPDIEDAGRPRDSAASVEKTAGFADTLIRPVKTVPVPSAPASLAPSLALQASCKICGDPRCGRHKGEPRSKCIHYQHPVLR